MKKTLLFLVILMTNFFYGQVTIYETSHASNQGAEITPTANGPACQMGDAITLGGTARYLNSITVDLFNLNDASPFSVTMTLYNDCPSSTSTGSCGSGPGTLIPGSSVTVNVTAPPTTLGTIFQVVFPFNEFDLNSETDNTITVMINASRNNVLWRIGETATVGSMPATETGNGFATRCGSTASNNGCARNFGIPNNFAMTILASATLTNENFASKDFTMYPNPVTSELNIVAPTTSLIKSLHFTDINGRVVKQLDKVNSNSSQINLTDLSKGIYLVKISTDEGNTIKKFIKE
ncbi:T9SS type A sorting domain-containing protein [Flavobacterium haoranii]|uniref:Por secretion system C-terminal sorting domain-containing protein n=1 Tax=Flavobacterium haoranii TaxID=683124 RepID=A0A1M6HRC6_9FLAO|nr:T9SS type A sorting domain-containing protein [Flavobacterium haoranii]SHJ24741.1 Por secretion system C-terminal sorting domain-containing protein [Flavobacterium haoranii]